MKLDDWKCPSLAERQYCAGVLEWQGNVAAVPHKSTPYMRLVMKSPYLRRLQAFQKACGGLGHISGPFKPTGHSRKPQYHLEVRGIALALFENVVSRLLRTERSNMFFVAREKLRRLQQERDLVSPYKIPRRRGSSPMQLD